MMHLLVGKLPLLDYGGETLDHRHPAADTFALLAGQLAGVEQVTRADSTAGPTVRAFRVERGGREPLLVLWDERDPFDGEDAPPIAVSLPWPAPAATAVDALGNPHPTEVRGGHLRLRLSLTPVFVTNGSGGLRGDPEAGGGVGVPAGTSCAFPRRTLVPTLAPRSESLACTPAGRLARLRRGPRSGPPR